MRDINLGFNPTNEASWTGRVNVESYMRVMVFWDGKPYIVSGDHDAVKKWFVVKLKMFKKPMLTLRHYYSTMFGEKRSWTYSMLRNCGPIDVERTDSSNEYLISDYYHGNAKRCKRTRWVFTNRWGNPRDIILETRHIPKRCPRQIKDFLKEYEKSKK